MLSTFGLILASVMAVWIALLAWRERRAWARWAEYRCARCDYALTGTPGECCPECGAPISMGVEEASARSRRLRSALWCGLGLTAVGSWLATIVVPW